MNIDTVDTLHAQHNKGENWDHDLLMQTILELLSGPFNDDNYRNYSPDNALEEIEGYLFELMGTSYEKKAKRILRKVKKLETIKEIILYLGEIILSD